MLPEINKRSDRTHLGTSTRDGSYRELSDVVNPLSCQNEQEIDKQKKLSNGKTPKCRQYSQCGFNDANVMMCNDGQKIYLQTGPVGPNSSEVELDPIRGSVRVVIIRTSKGYGCGHFS